MTTAREAIWVALRNACRDMEEAHGAYLAAAKREAGLTAKILEDEGYGGDHAARWARAFLAGRTAECRRILLERYPAQAENEP